MAKKNKPEFKIGDKIYYRKVTQHWQGQYTHSQVVAETPRSWIVLDVKSIWLPNPTEWQVAHYGFKLPKALTGFQIGTKEIAERALWASEHHYRIRRQFEFCRDAETIIAVARVLNFTLPEGETNYAKANADAPGTEAGTGEAGR